MLNGKGASFMPTNDSEQKPTQPAGFQSMLARLRGMVQALKSSDENDTAAHEELLPTWDTGVPPPVDSPGDGKLECLAGFGQEIDRLCVGNAHELIVENILQPGDEALLDPFVKELHILGAPR